MYLLPDMLNVSPHNLDTPPHLRVTVQITV